MGCESLNIIGTAGHISYNPTSGKYKRDSQCCAECTSGFQTAMFAKVYRIVGYSDGDLDTSSCALTVASSDPAWDGSFHWDETQSCCTWRPPSSNLSIDGITLAVDQAGNSPCFSTITSIDVSFIAGNWRSQIEICHWASSSTLSRIWTSLVKTAATPDVILGTYTRATGCAATPSSLVIGL